MSTTFLCSVLCAKLPANMLVTSVIVQHRAACVTLDGKRPGSVRSVGITVNLPPGSEEGNRHIDDAVHSVLRVPH